MTSWVCFGCFAVVFIIMKGYSSDAESLPNLDELLVSSFNSEVSDDEGRGLDNKRMLTA